VTITQQKDLLYFKTNWIHLTKNVLKKRK